MPQNQMKIMSRAESKVKSRHENPQSSMQRTGGSRYDLKPTNPNDIPGTNGGMARWLIMTAIFLVVGVGTIWLLLIVAENM